MKPTILVTEKEFSKSEDFFKSIDDFNIVSAPADENALAEAIITHNCRAVIIGVEKYTGPLYEALGQTGNNNGAIIARYGVGHDGVNKQLAKQHNIIVTNTPGALDASVAEHTIWLMGTLARNITISDAEMRNRHFSSRMGIELNGKTLLIVGFGSIGKRVAKIAAFGLDMKVIAVDVLEESENRVDKLRQAYGIMEYTTDVENTLPKADIISIHMPSIPATHHFFNAARLAKLKLSAMLVNTARGPVIDETALFDVLADKRIAGAALDVFETEPYQPAVADKDLRTLDNVVLTPHIGSNTRESNNRMANDCIKNIRDFFNGALTCDIR